MSKLTDYAAVLEAALHVESAEDWSVVQHSRHLIVVLRRGEARVEARLDPEHIKRKTPTYWARILAVRLSVLLDTHAAEGTGELADEIALLERQEQAEKSLREAVED